MITKQEYLSRLANLQRKASENDLEAFLVSSEESIYYLTGVPYRPLERPFFIVVWARLTSYAVGSCPRKGAFAGRAKRGAGSDLLGLPLSSRSGMGRGVAEDSGRYFATGYRT